jgi:hypothetical protein
MRLLRQVRQVAAEQVAQVVGQARQEVVVAGYVPEAQVVQVTTAPDPLQTEQLGTTVVQRTQAVPATLSTICGVVLQTQLAPEASKVTLQLLQLPATQVLQLGWQATQVDPDR